MALSLEFSIWKNLYFPLAAVLIDLLYLPNNADPLNPVKFWFLGFFALSCLSSILSDSFFLKEIRLNRALLLASILAIIFAFMLILSFIFTDVKTIGLIGFTGRNNGLLSYLFLTVVFIAAAFKLEFSLIRTFYLVIASALGFFSLYGFFQHFGADPIKWKSEYNPISLIVGNPDFAAALLGLLATILCSILFTQFSIKLRIIVFVLVSFAVIVIYWSQARQGLVAVAIGVGLIFVIALWQKSRRLSLSLLFCEFVAGIFSILGMLQVGPLTHYFYKASINDRGYDWRAAWHMFVAHPWFGVGLDRYSAYFLRYRDPKYPLIYGYSQTVDNAHNVFLELFATGGIFVGSCYIAIIVFVGVRAYKAWKSYEGNSQILVSGLIAGWVVFVAQSIISVDNLCVSIWGWLLGGFIVALSVKRNGPRYQKQGRVKSLIKGVSLKRLALFFVFSSLLLSVAIPMYQSEKKMKYFQQLAAPAANSASEQSIYAAIADKTFQSPLLNVDYKTLIAFSVTNNGLLDQGTSYFQKILKDDPRQSDAHQFLATIYEHSKNYQLAINHRLAAKSLDPYGAPNLIGLENDYVAIGNLDSARQIRDLIIQIAPGSQIAQQASKLLPM